MKPWIVAVLVEIGLAAVCLAGTVASWGNARRATEFVGSGEQFEFEAVRYVPPMLALSTGLAILAGLLLIDAVARTLSARERRVASHTAPPML
ncbi:hypothetical protein [Nocardia caishijiensis]|uniref:Uncharacterized protein n=1 Tax=Nocardia caishijiensis TaxID=184756 RepID=A0ABQ6YT10_9NOCA|nr:hypothetical protein [Nocardia caishijiensis]KAF0848938.1 hypothetical protein FNL39_101373 [Nocardia caishijiensis]